VLGFDKRLLCICTIALSFLISPAAQSQNVVVAELTEGLWAEGRDLDAFGDRPVQLWLPEGSLIFDIRKTERVTGNAAAKYRSATTFHGYPVNLELVPKRGDVRYRVIDEQDKSQRFRLLQSVYCPGETNPIATASGTCEFGEPVGEGWVFTLSNVETTALGPKLTATAYPDAKTAAELDQVSNGIYSFDIYERDLDRFEKKGVLFRLDRDHPLNSFSFVGRYYFPCNSQETVEFREEQVKSAFAKASVETEVGFWSWFKAKGSAGYGFEDTGTSISSSRTVIDSSKASVFHQWGLMKTSEGTEIPFNVEKRFECQSGHGIKDPGDWITSVIISFWDEEEARNSVYEFDNVSNWVSMDETKISKRHHQRPIFFSVNDSTKQAQVIQKILSDYPDFSYDQAVFVFAQLNNGCSGRFRSECNNATDVNLP